MSRIRVYRVQAFDGRGPWRPGFSQRWIDGDAPADRLTETAMDLLPIEVWPSLPADMVHGSACRTLDGLMRWFTPKERAALAALGFHPVQLTVDVVHAESPWQLLVGRKQPFAIGATRLQWNRWLVP